MKWTDAAERILRDEGTPLNYRELAQRIVSRDLVATTSATPEITLHVSVSTENRRNEQRGIRPRFSVSAGEIGLAEWDVGELEEAFETLAQASDKARRDLLKKLRQLEGSQFEAYLEVLFTGMGYDVTVTGGPDDDGVDLIAELESGVGLQRVGVQAKCQSGRRSVGPNPIRLLRDALSTHACNAGAVVTTTTFDPRAVEVAAELGKFPIELIDCHALVELAVQYEVGVRRELLPVHVEALDDAFAVEEK
jgi:restriction endonuclease Mrr